jgi:hypothetical protein
MKDERVLVKIWRFFRPVLIIDLVLLIVVGVSFLFARPFSVRAYSDRLFWGGIVAILVGGIGVFASFGSYSTLGTPSVVTAPGDARIAHERIREHIRMNAGRYSFIGRMFTSGAICITISAILEILTRSSA